MWFHCFHDTILCHGSGHMRDEEQRLKTPVLKDNKTLKAVNRQALNFSDVLYRVIYKVDKVLL